MWYHSPDAAMIAALYEVDPFAAFTDEARAATYRCNQRTLSRYPYTFTIDGVTCDVRTRGEVTP